MQYYLIRFAFLLYVIVPFIRDYRSLDLMAGQWAFLSLVNIFVFGFIYSFKELREIFHTILKNDFNIIYFLFILCCFPSFFVAQNYTLTIVDLTRHINVFASIILLATLIQHTKNGQNIIFILLAFVLIVETLEMMASISNHKLSLDSLIRSKNLMGFTSNINVAAFSLLIKVPIIHYFISKSKNIYFKGYLIILLTAVIFFILLLQSRASFLALLGYLTIYILSIFYNSQIGRKQLLYLVGPGIIALSSFVAVSYENFPTERITNIANDSSANERLRFWKGGINHVLDHPFYGCGLGNWKLTSIAIDSKELLGYTVPYHMHNDFLQMAAELGIIGFILFILLFWKLFKHLQADRKLVSTEVAVALLGCLLIYMTDAFFNFPHERAISQSLFVIIAAATITLKKDEL